MKMLELAQCGFPVDVVALWQREAGDTLLPVQESAIKRFGLFEGGNLLVQAPTSSGKTLIGEMAAVKAALAGKQVIYLCPIKALAEEKYAEFSRKYAEYGMDVIVSTRDHREFDARFESGDFNIAVAVYEKFAQLLVRRPERLREVALVVADELELMSDTERGAAVEVLLTQVVRSGCRVIGLSAVLGGADRLAAWMSARLLTHERRPIELRHGVVHEGRFRYRTVNEPGEAEEAVAPVASESPWEILTHNVVAMASRGEGCLVFVKGRQEARRGAELLARRMDAAADATRAIECLRDLEPTHARETLLETVPHGVAFHNADLTPDERRVVEQSFRDGEVTVLVSTSTLAQGMNLPARNVFIATDKWRYDRRHGMPWKTPIQRGEYENMGGRAARCGSGVAFGRALLIAPTAFDQETLWRRYVEGEREVVTPQLAQEPLEDYALKLIAARTCTTQSELLDFLHDTPSGRWVWEAATPLQELEARVRAAVNRCVDAGMVRSVGEGRLEATPMGRAVAAKGIRMATALDLANWVRVSERRDWQPLDLLLAAALTPDGRLLHVAFSAREYEMSDYPGRLKERTKAWPTEPDTPLNRLRQCSLTPFFEEVRAVKAALFLHEWTEHAALYDLEESYAVMAGQILAAADQIAWLVDATAAIARACGCHAAFIASIEDLAQRVQRGLREECLAVARLRLPSLSREGAMTLATHGLAEPAALRDASLAILTQWMNRRDAETLQAWARRQKAAPLPAAASAHEHAHAPAPVAGPTLVVDERRPGAITLDGVTIALQEKQFRLMEILAASPGECVPYEAIYAHVWGDAVVESQQMHFQKRKLVEQIAKACPNRGDIVQTVKKRGFMLEVPASSVVLRTSALSHAA